MSSTSVPQGVSPVTEKDAGNQKHHDLTVEDGVREYLAGTPFAATRVEALSGGSANYVYRIWLETPYEGRRTVVLKHTKPYVRAFKDMAFTDERQVSSCDRHAIRNGCMTA